MGAGGMQGPTIAQYYPDMSSPDGYEMMDGPLSSGGRSKKDVKRRTKTGCLTCRKRRIKVCYFILLADLSFLLQL
jgi:hypothetical protein